MMKFFAIVLTCAALLAASGCGRSGPISIQGTVTVDGKPLERGKIDFLAVEDKGPTAAAVIKDGKYECEAMPGKKNVRITGGKVVGQHRYTPDNPASPMVEEVKSLIPDRYNAETPLSCEIEYGKSLYDFPLQTKP
jgi:hypothetical protein